ncbi:MAG: hypothetical protein HY810_10745 [Candidatus Omnitrophica bacterium]|nr:hypothetical protein [Candidatus Omnitrophota bacterium]
MDTNQTKEEIIYKPSLLLKIVRFAIFCFSFFLGGQIVRSGEGKIPYFIMFLLPLVTLIPLVETFICKIRLSTSGIKVRNITQNWTINWDQITSWKIITKTSSTVASAGIGTHFIFYRGNKSYFLGELHKYSALKHLDEITDWVKKHIKNPRAK